MILLDTDVLIEIIDKKSSTGKQVLNTLNELNYDILTSTLNLEEILFGIFKKHGIYDLPEDHPLTLLPVLPFTKKDAILAAQIELQMEKKGMNKPRGDILIAAVSITNEIPILTFNTNHFEDIPDVMLFDLNR